MKTIVIERVIDGFIIRPFSTSIGCSSVCELEYIHVCKTTDELAELMKTIWQEKMHGEKFPKETVRTVTGCDPPY